MEEGRPCRLQTAGEIHKGMAECIQLTGVPHLAVAPTKDSESEIKGSEAQLNSHIRSLADVTDEFLVKQGNLEKGWDDEDSFDFHLNTEGSSDESPSGTDRSCNSPPSPVTTDERKEKEGKTDKKADENEKQEENATDHRHRHRSHRRHYHRSHRHRHRRQRHHRHRSHRHRHPSHLRGSHRHCHLRRPHRHCHRHRHDEDSFDFPLNKNSGGSTDESSSGTDRSCISRHRNRHCDDHRHRSHRHRHLGRSHCHRHRHDEDSFDFPLNKNTEGSSDESSSGTDRSCISPHTPVTTDERREKEGKTAKKVDENEKQEENATDEAKAEGKESEDEHVCVNYHPQVSDLKSIDSDTTEWRKLYDEDEHVYVNFPPVSHPKSIDSDTSEDRELYDEDGFVSTSKDKTSEEKEEDKTDKKVDENEKQDENAIDEAKAEGKESYDEHVYINYHPQVSDLKSIDSDTTEWRKLYDEDEHVYVNFPPVSHPKSIDSDTSEDRELYVEDGFVSTSKDKTSEEKEEDETDKKVDENEKQDENATDEAKAEGKESDDEDGYVSYTQVAYPNSFDSDKSEESELYDEDGCMVHSGSAHVLDWIDPALIEPNDTLRSQLRLLMGGFNELGVTNRRKSSSQHSSTWTIDIGGLSLSQSSLESCCRPFHTLLSSEDDFSRSTSACNLNGRRNLEASFELPMNIDTDGSTDERWKKAEETDKQEADNIEQTEIGRDGARAKERESYDEDATDALDTYVPSTQVMQVSGDNARNFLELTQQRTFVRLKMDEDRECMFFSPLLNVSICYAPGTYATPPIPHGEIIVGMSENPADMPTLRPGQRRISSVLMFMPHGASFSRSISLLFLLHSDPEPDSIIKVLHSATNVTEETRWQEADVDCLVLDGHINLSIRHFCSYCVIDEKVLATPQPRHFGTFVYLRKKHLPGMVCVEVTVQLSGKPTGGVTPALGDKNILVRQEAFTLVNSKPLTLKLVPNNVGWQLHKCVKQQVLYETDFPPPSAAVPAGRTFNLCIDRDHASADTLDFIIHISQCQGRELELQIYESLMDIFPQPLPPSVQDWLAGNVRAAPGHLYSEGQHIHPGGSANPNVQVGPVEAPVSQYPFYQPIHRGLFHSYQQDVLAKHQEENAIPSAGAFDDDARHFPEAQAGVNLPASAAAAQVTGTGGRVLEEAYGGSKRVTISPDLPPSASGPMEGHWNTRRKVEGNGKESSEHKYQLVSSESSANGGSIPSRPNEELASSDDGRLASSDDERLASSDDGRLASSDAAFVASTMPKLHEVDRVLRSVLSHPAERLAWPVPYEKCQVISDHLDREPGTLTILASQLKFRTAIPQEEDQDGFSPTVQMLRLWMQKRQAEGTSDECYQELITALRNMGKQNIIKETQEKTVYEE